uniref:Tetraspanin n=1 Tax=Octopus bimaculoides TaxID=37653 RepID=A0A0L8HB60_OCTBM
MFCLVIIIIFCFSLLQVLGAAIFGFCLWLRLDFWYDHNIGVNSVLKIYHIAIYIAIAVGGLIIIFGIIGCVGAIASRLVLLVLFQNTISEGNLFRGFIQTDYGNDQGKTRIIDFVQWKLKCCGGQRYTDYLDSSWAHQDQNHIGQVPLSCCADYKSNEASNINNHGCKADGNLSYKKGCGRAIVNLVEKRLLLITGIVVAILGLQLFGFLFIVLLICYLRKPPPQQPDDVVYEMARTQEKAPYPTRGNTYSNL